jgi:DNA-binding GntR family transcriptional regulator
LRPTNTGRPHDAVMLIGLRERWIALSAAPVEANPEFVILDEQFHVRLAEASENRELAAMLQHINERIRIVRMRDFLTVDRVAQTIAEHLGLLELVIEGRLDDAVSAYGRHVATSLEVVEQRVAGALMGMVSQR